MFFILVVMKELNNGADRLLEVGVAWSNTSSVGVIAPLWNANKT
jgi:hypothetical protein